MKKLCIRDYSYTKILNDSVQITTRYPKLNEFESKEHVFEILPRIFFIQSKVFAEGQWKCYGLEYMFGIHWFLFSFHVTILTKKMNKKDFYKKYFPRWIKYMEEQKEKGCSSV